MMLLLMLLLLSMTVAEAQIVIGGSVYGGGNEGNVGGSAAVTVRAGDIDKVYGGARMANIAGNAFVNIDGEHASNYILINYVYGGNDIAGTIGTPLQEFDLPTALSTTHVTRNNIDRSWNAFVHISDNAAHNQLTYIGQLFGGGNGDYDYTSDNSPYKAMVKPNLGKTYLEILGGSIVYAYGGGNDATVTDRTVICLDNPSAVVNSITDATNPNAGTGGQLLINDRFEHKMGINLTYSYPESDAFQIGRLFGGNNKADMAIRPRWDLQKGKVRMLYGGGNEGRMTTPEGLLLKVEGGADMIVDNVYGGCRRADVKPLYDNDDNRPVAYDDIQLDPIDNPNKAPGGYSARVRILGGNVNNVYGGNDISGDVYGGTTVAIFSNVRGNVYGGGNGSYAYTDNAKLKDDPKWQDFYYNPKEILNLEGDSFTGLQSVEALNIFRPNAERVSMFVRGTQENPVTIGGALYVGGNSASIREQNTIENNIVSAGTTTHLKLGSYVTIDSVFLGNNGADMIRYNVADAAGRGEGVLRTLKSNQTAPDNTSVPFSQMNLEIAEQFNKYMEGCAMKVKPSLLFESTSRKEPYDYIPYSSYIGSFFCGGNVGSILVDGKMTININHELVIFDKLVGGSNNAKVSAVTGFNAEHTGGLIGAAADPVAPQTIGDKLEMNLSGLKMEPKRWKDKSNKSLGLIWNTQLNGVDCDPVTPTGSESYPIASESNDVKRRLVGGNIYGGCCESGIVNGNVVINMNATIVERDKIFDEVQKNPNDGEEHLYGENPLTPGAYQITKRNTGVILAEQGMDVLGSALNVYGGGKGKGTEIWGSTTINMNRGYVFQVFGGSEEGVIGQRDNNGDLSYNEAYSCYVNLKGAAPGVSKTNAYNEAMPECEFIYGGGFMGPVAGNTVIKLGNGRIFNSFAGSCYADILGHTETYVGYRHTYKDETDHEIQVDGFPWVRDYVYGGNDLGGSISGSKAFSGTDFVRSETDGKRYNTDALTASAYVEYRQGRAAGIFGGAYGTYDYKEEYSAYKTKQPFLGNAFINFRPTNTDELKSNVNNVIDEIYGAGQGYPGDGDADKMQNSSYILIDIPQEMTNFKSTKVFGAGAWSGLGIKENVPADGSEAARNGVSAIIDLVRGQLATAYGGSYREGVTRRSVINVPTGSTIAIGSIFGGAYGTETFSPCDVYEANVNYNSADATLIYDPATNERYQGAIYGGNNHERRTLYGRVNIGSKVVQKKVIQYKDEIKGMEKGQVLNTTATIYGAGRGANTWSEYTLVNLQNGAEVYEVYGGGQNGKVFNAESIENYISNYMPSVWPEGTLKAGQSFTQDEWKYAWTLGSSYDIADYWTSGNWKDVKDGERGYTPVAGKEYWKNTNTNLKNPLVRESEIEDRRFPGVSAEDKALVSYRNNANVIINQGAKVNNYAYGGGYGAAATVSGTTYIALLGGEVKKDIYAGGTSGSVADIFNAGTYSSTNPSGFVANATAYVAGGTVRNVYGGGWRGSVGYHNGEISNIANDDRDGEAHVVIGKQDGSSYTDGIPSITRNVYGGGEGGAIYGDAYVTVNNGYIGYRYNPSGTDTQTTTDIDEKYEPELDDATPGDNLLDKGGNVFGGGYVANSYVDRSYVTMMGGIVRGSLYGGGEVGPIGRGTVKEGAASPTDTFINANAKIYKGGETNVYMYDGHVMRDVFGGGRGYDNWGGEGWMSEEEQATMDKSSKGYVFGSTNVHIYGGEIGTETNVLKGYGNVFGGGNEGFVYSAMGTKSSTDGYYYKNGNTSDGLSADCKIAVEPRCKVTDAGGVTIGGTPYAQGDYVPVEKLNTLKSRANADALAIWNKLDTRGVTIHNALFAGGNITEGSDKIFANTITVYGNAAASLRDVYNFDLISLGTEEMGGLYGDGNLTLVDGFRELHIDNYGTDYYSLAKTLTINQYNELTTRQQAYYKLKYGAKNTHTYTYYESKQLHTYKYTDDQGTHEVSYRKGQKITTDTYNGFGENKSDPSNNESPLEKSFWTSGSKSYQKDEQIEEGEYSLMDGVDSEIEDNKTGEKANWTLLGVTSIYAGRPMNTIQRADFCGVFGSRMVMKGAVDRAPQVNGGVDYNSYTINRVEEVSLNNRTTTAGDTSDEDKEHGNYFGIYNSVKFLGNLTSDVAFTAVRKTDTNNTSIQANGTTTYYGWKKDNPQSKYRNNGISHNKVALASGVYLELKKEETESAGHDVWGHITGVIELDLINVMPGMGGGYVYAKNEHGTPTQVDNVNKVSLLSYNTNASTYRQYTYSGTETIETSGNFVHNTKQIVDDCYPNSGIYNDGYVASPAHYWFIRGSIYVYEQYISAYTGAANATAEKQEIPLTITAASNGRMTLRDVKSNWYAYYDKNGNKLGDLTANADTVFVVNNVAYKLNQPISDWEYNLLSEGDQAKFVKQTYVVIEDCKIGETEYKKGRVLLETEYNSLKTNPLPAVTYMEGDVKKTDGDFNYFFRSSNNLSHETGYVLTYDVNNPMVWNNYYTLTASPGQANSLNTKLYEEGKDNDGNTITKSNYTEGPTYTLNGNEYKVCGQQEYTKGSIIYGSVVTNYKENIYDPTNNINHLGANPPTQAIVEQAYVVKENYTLKDNEGEVVQELVAGTPIYRSKYSTEEWTTMTSANVVELAKVCTSLLEISTTDYVWAGKVLSSADIADLKTKIIAKNNYVDDGKGTADAKATTFLNSYLDDAYYCTSEGKYGGIYFQPGKAYRALDTWCSMPAEERANFTFNYDALDLLIDSNFSDPYGAKVKYDGPNTDKVYSSTQPIDYQAEFVGYKDENDSEVNTIEFTPKGAASATTINKSTSQNDWLTREAYEAIPNEKRHYSPITITAPGDYYMVRTTFMDGEIPYTTGQQIDKETYDDLGTIKQENIDVITFTSNHTSTPTKNDKNEDVYVPKAYYYCRDGYTIDEKGMGVAVTTTEVTVNNTPVSSASYAVDSNVPKGVVINETTYDGLCNFQKGFVIHGTSPTEVSTLYVSNESDIHDLSTEKIITVVYLYEYDESDESGLNVTPVSERHIVNIHINFKSGVPEIGDITKPDIVLPGTTLGMTIPSVTQGAFRVTESGWEIFSNDDDAATHYNGVPFVNNETPLYWYQNNYWLAYYAQTSLGKTYSKSVKLSVANYHDLKKVMDDTQHHYYIDHKDVERKPKIYINDYKVVDAEGHETAESKNGLDLLKNLIDLSNGKALEGHSTLNLSNSAKPMRGGQYLDFFLRTDLDHSGSTWTSIADNENECFSATLHGDGHTISGLDHSLINRFCGHIYNLGVTGSFTSSGIAETGDGYMENCWVKTTGTPAANTHPLFNTPTATNYNQVVNGYYQNDYTSFTDNKNRATVKPAKSFYNGEVAYNLNGFYLNKRYYEGTNTTEPDTPADQSLTSGSSYVTGRYADGDFIYANGTIPSSLDERAVKDNNGNPIWDANGKIQYTPKWPDDYIFFGQTLNYGHVDNVAHQDVPSAITAINRVYRAPAYFGNKTMSVAHFNPNAIFAKSKKGDENVKAYEGMTAIDFTGNGDATYQQGLNGGKFYAPLLDDGGLTDFTNVDLTSNLLVYTDTSNEEATNTNNVVMGKLTDKAYQEVNSTYHTVATVTDDIRGHWVQKVGDAYKAVRDHFLVDKEDFNAPISYSFGEGKRMWYQRLPENYVGKKNAAGTGYIDNGAGWEGISLPFTAEIVTTNTKGELTHFYGGSSKGHEYWLRKYEGGALKSGSSDIFEATFNRPAAVSGDKQYTNTFLWDYYYSRNSRADLNSDQYPDATYKYYSESRTYTDYPRLASATPYIIGFPGERYYEFDLSGNFESKTAYEPYAPKLSQQIVTFASAPGTATTIGVSDTEMANGKAAAGGYTFMPNYGTKTLAGVAYVLNTNDEMVDNRGNSYKKVESGAVTVPFRPYFVTTPTTPTPAAKRASSIIFSNESTQLQGNDNDLNADDKAYNLDIYAKRKKIVVESNLRETTEVRIVNATGITVSTFTIEPGETVETRVNTSGVYIVLTSDGRYNKKLAVR